MSIQFSDEQAMREGHVAGGMKWLRVDGPATHAVGAKIVVSVTIAGRRYDLDGMIVEVTPRDSLLYITKASAGWATLAARAC
jgi:hypothetical protein